MNEQELEKLADELLYVFSLVNPKIGGKAGMSERTATVLAFEEYILNQAGWQIIHKYCNKFTAEDMAHFKSVVRLLTARYLTDNGKTLAIY